MSFFADISGVSCHEIERKKDTVQSSHVPCAPKCVCVSPSCPSFLEGHLVVQATSNNNGSKIIVLLLHLQGKRNII
jgi:hypothetical protein